MSCSRARILGSNQDEAVDASVDPYAACIDFQEELDPDHYIIKAVEGEEPAVVEEATLAAREVAKCERLRAWAVSENAICSS